MVKYGDISKDRLKPFDDDFEGKIKLAAKLAGANDKTATTLKWSNGISAKVVHKTSVNLPVFDETSLSQTVEFSSKDATLTSEFNKACTKFTGKWNVAAQGTTSEYTLQKAFGPVVAVANSKIDTEGSISWKVNAAFETKADDQTTVQVGGQVNDEFKPALALGVVSGAFGNLMFSTDLAKKHSSASLFPLTFLDFGYNLSVGHSAEHTSAKPFNAPSLVMVAANKCHTIKAKYANFDSQEAVPSVSLIMKAPFAFTGTWSHSAKKGHVFGVNMTL
eukprot:TRINITY_DN575_c0_g2_i1.p2 TRINITY_DN575_c0_g2~~TRINITY_DN575_c0_g2_i1.p2  ORF type:complete len:276 (+),score=172.70 TRINITY_DN575_c0_g2_i1:67-894(+)